MARIRTIKPEFFTSADIVSLSPLARLLYVATWCEADKEGRLVWKPATFKLRYLPGDACDVQALCDEVVKAGLVVLYGDGFAYIPAFKAHQHINPRESASQLPDPDACGTRQPRVGTRQSRDSDAHGGREGKGKEGVIYASSFETFWKAYPKKRAKDDALKAFEKRKPDSDLLAAMLLAIETQRASDEWVKESGKYIPYPATWLNDGRWQDEMRGGVDLTGDDKPTWAVQAGFANRFEAGNEGCFSHNAGEFIHGKRAGVSA